MLPLSFVVVMAGSVVLMRKLGLSNTKKLEDDDKLRKTGEAARATVIRADDIGSGFNRKPFIQLVVTVEREGHPSYQATFVALIPLIAIPRVQPGCQIPVFEAVGNAAVGQCMAGLDECGEPRTHCNGSGSRPSSAISIRRVTLSIIEK